MKKITIFILTIFTVATLFAAARPSLDGRAVVAESGTMPRGLFARTVGYLPGDSVTVTNPATGSTVDVLILGAIDPSEGVAILLSPEAADGLRIKPDSNVQVKLTKRSGSLDENANGSAVLSDISDEEKSEDTNADFEEYPAIAEESAPAKNEVLAEVPAVEETVVPEPEEIAVSAESAVEEADSEKIEEIPVVAEEKTVVEEKPVEESPVLESLVVAPANDVEPETVYEELPLLPEENLEKVAEDDLIEEDDKVQKVVLIETEAAVEESSNEEEAKPVSEELAFVADEKVENVAGEIPETDEEKVQLDYIAEETLDSSEKLEAEEVPYSEEAELAVAEPEESDAYQPIILVPAEPKAPVAQKIESVPCEEKASEEKVEVAEEREKAVKSEVAAKPVVSNDWSNYVVPSLKNLRSGSYYVQVASLGNTENIKTFVDKYSMKYPVVLVQNSSKTAYQVMVGPLNIDEYGSVGEKFKGYGFKDSFVRKIR